MKTNTPIYGETTLQEIRNLPEFKEFGDFLFWRGKTAGTDESDYNLRQHAFESRGGEIADFLKGLHRMQELISQGVRIAYDFWCPEEIEAEPDRSQTKLFYFPCGEEDRPFVLFIGGVAYEDIYSLGQGFPCAARANELGYNAFVLSYRCIGPDTSGIMPKPIHDLVKALDFIFKSPFLFPVKRENYAICGFSAGGHLTAEWGTDNFGYKSYQMPAPAALLLCYALTEVDENMGERVLHSMVGEQRDSAYIHSYHIAENMSEDYPPTFLCHCKNDALLPFAQSERMAEKLTEQGVPHVLKAVERGYHGYGLGSGSMWEGWLEEAIAFWEKQFQ